MPVCRNLIVAWVLGACAPWALAQSYHAVALPEGAATGMSSCGWITGVTARNTFIYHDGVFQRLQMDAFYGKAVNNYGDVAGRVVGGKVQTIDTAAVFLYGADGAHGIYRVYGVNSQGTGINDDVVAVGVASPVVNPGKSIPFMFHDGKTTNLQRRNNQLLTGVNASGQIVGTQYDGTLARAFIHDGSDVFLVVAGAKSTIGNAINDAGVAVGHGITQEGLDEGFVYAGGVGSFIGLASNSYNHGSNLVALNNLGQAVGTITDGSGFNHAMLYSQGRITDLNDVSDAPEPLVSAVGISDGGEIAVNSASGAGYLLVPGGVVPPNTCKTR